MLKAKAYEEIKNFKEQIYGGLTTRQLICGILGILVVAGVYFVAKRYTTEDMASWICIVAFIPFYFVGFRQKNGMSYEKYLKVKLKFDLMGASKRTFHAENFYESVEKNKKTGKKQK